MHRPSTAFLIAVTVLGLFTNPAAAQERRTIWSGIFSEPQALRGEKAYVGTCARCHMEDLGGKNGPALKGSRFIEDWREADLAILFSTVKSMPPNSARNPRPPLPEDMSLDILTYLLKVNGAPAGLQELTIEGLPSIQFEKQTGPEPVPNLALVRVVGCLSQSSPAVWTLISGSDPARAMNPDVLSPADLVAAKSTTPGKNTYRLGQIAYIEKPIEDHKDHMVAIKGALVRQDQGTRINLTALETIAATCQ